jgi:protein SCO1
MGRRMALVAAIVAASALLHMQATAAHEAHHPTPVDASSKPARVSLRDIHLVDLDGMPVRFKSEAVGNRIVVVDFIYTSCTTICPMTSTIIGKVQDRLMETLGEGFGRDVKLITLTVDPATDTPERLKDYAANFGSPAGWLWLTGDKPQVNKVLIGLGAYAVDFTRHSGAVLVGDAQSDDWIRLYGIPDPGDIVDHVKRLLAARSRAGFIGRR